MLRNLLPFVFFGCALSANEIVVDVCDPVHQEGELYTEKGGVITTKDMRIQASHISLKEINGEKIITAKGDLLIVYGHKFLIGDAFTYNFEKREGVLENGVSEASNVFAGGKKIHFQNDGKLKIEEAYVTTSDDRNYNWSVNAKDAELDKKRKVGANGITLSVLNAPVMAFPFYTVDAKPKNKVDPVVRYRVMWEKGQGPLLLMRYRAYDADGLKVHLRGEYRVKPESRTKVKQGVGGAIELDYEAPSKRQKISSRNFYAYETFYNDNNPNRLKNRYRIQGIYSGESKDKHIESFCRWDVLSDKNMRQDFPTQLFELQTLERTEAFVKARYDSVFASLYGRPRVNSFRGFVQELPTLKAAIKPFEIGSTGVIVDNYFNLSFLDYVYANNLLPNFHAGRFETKQGIHRAFEIGPLAITSKAGFEGIYYTNNPESKEAHQMAVTYNLDAALPFQKSFESISHHIEPYASFKGIEDIGTSPSNVYIFSIRDGFHKMQELKFGLKNAFYSNTSFSPEPRYFIDMSAYSFFNAKTFTLPVPKAHLAFGCRFSQAAFTSKIGYNIEQKTLDFANFNLACTLSQYMAFSLELRHRGSYDWKKNDHSNYIVDVTRTEYELRNSPLSDKRTIFLARWEMQLAPLWTLQVQHHLGWRPQQPFYHESKVDLFTLIANCWKLRLSYMRAVNTNQFTFGITLI